MSVRNLDAIFRPRSVALIGASTRPQSVGLVVAQNLLAGGFSGPIMPVNPKHANVAGVQAYSHVDQLPVVPDLAVICTPPAAVPGIVADLGRRGTKGVVVITSGFRELGNAEGRALEQRMLDTARPFLMRVVGPNCVGVMSTAVGLNASFAHIAAKKGQVAFVTQSGAMATTVLDWAAARDIGFSHLVSLGDMADVDFGDMLDYLANDPGTNAILLYIEAITSPRKFMSAARTAARLKPVIAIKAGRHAAAAKAASSHTGAMAGVDEVYDAAFQRAGILRVRALGELFDAVETLSGRLTATGERLAIVTNGGGVGVLATDALLDEGGHLAELSPETLTRLDAVLPRTWPRNNPIDIGGDALAGRYADALNVVFSAPEIDAVLVLNCPTALASGLDSARAVVETVAIRRRPVLTAWLGSGAALEARHQFTTAGIPTYDTPDDAIRGFMHLVRHRRGQDILMEVPPSSSLTVSPNSEQARRVIADRVAKGGGWLNADDVRRILQCYGIPTVRSEIVGTVAEAEATAIRFGGRVALKIASPDIVHKSDVGGVALDLDGASAVQAAAVAMLDRAKRLAPKARLAGFVVQDMIHRPAAWELILGMAVDPLFGPVLLFGQGGTGVEVIADKALALPPLNLPLARELMARTRIFRQMKGYRDHPPADLDATARTLTQLSQLVCDLDDVAEIDINPLLVDADGALALDARIRVEKSAPVRRPGGRLVIPPYPKELERLVTVAGIGQVRLRPVRPEDAPAYLRFFEALDPQDIRMRFFAPLDHLSRPQLARFTQIDYDREMAFVLEATDSAPDLLGVARLVADPDDRKAEFAVTVRSDLKGRGIGELLMRRLIDHARQRGIGEIFGDVLQENAAMTSLARKLGFSMTSLAESSDILRVTLALTPTHA